MKNHQITKPMNNSSVNKPTSLTGYAMQQRSEYTSTATAACNHHLSLAKKFKWLVLACLFMVGISAKAQLFPVYLKVTGDYSFSGSIADIANGTIGKYGAVIQTNDQSVTSREVFLKITIDGMGINATTSPNWYTITPVTITKFNSIAIDKQVLKDYFDYDNLTGISPQQFTNLLPEGTYTITFEVFDYNNLTTAISNKVFFNVNVSHGTPPQVISPACGSVLGRLSSIPIVWSPAVARGFTIKYELEYVIDDHNILTEGNYQTALESTDTKVTGILGNSYSFIPDAVFAELPFRFIYRIKAIATSIPDMIEVPVIAGDGYSDICSFDYKPDVQAEPCTEIISVAVDNDHSGSTFANIVWNVKSDTEVAGQKYTLSYKPSAMTGISACEIPNITAKNCKINDLSSGITYRFTVTSECNSVLSEKFVDYLMPKAVSPVASCGEKPPFDPVNASNLLGELKNGDVIYLKDVPIVIEIVPDDILVLINKTSPIYSKLPKRNSDGSFIGYGRITFTIPLFQQYTPGVAVIFKNLFIDKDYKVIAGYVETIYDPENWKEQIANLNYFNKGGKLFEKIMTDGFKPGKVVDGVIGDTINIVVDKTASPFTVTIKYTTPTTTGKTQEEPFTLPSSGGTGDVPIEVEGAPYHYYVIEDADKTYYGIDLTTGAVICIGRYNPDINDILAAIDPDKINHAYKITFENASDAVFAFDPANPVYNSNMLFQKPYVMEGSPDYPLRWKFMTTGSGMDKVVAKMPAGIEQNKETLKFVVTSNNTEVDYTPGAAGSDIVLNLMPATADAVYSVHAVVNTGTATTPHWQQAGRFDVFTRTAKNYSVTLVPMGGSVPSKTDVKTALDAIWSRYGITWTVNVDDQFYTSDRATTIDGIINKIGTNKIMAGDQFLSEYSQQQLEINLFYKNYAVGINQYSKETMYLFVLASSAAPEDNQLGDMPLGKQWGYLFGSFNNRTLAHELGHGKTKLDHTFYDGNISQSTTRNLMDYSTGDSLVRCQWEYIHNPAVFDPVQDDEDAAEKGVCVGYVICESNAQARKTIYPYSIVDPTIILEKGREIIFLNKFGDKNQYSKIKYKNESIEYGIMNKSIKAIYKLPEKEKHMLLSDLESYILPYSSIKPQTQPQSNNKKGDYIYIDKTCGDYYRIEKTEDTNEGYWILKNALIRVDKEGKDNFDDMSKVTLGTGSVDPAELAKIITNRNSINDRTKTDVYGSNILKPKGSGYVYYGVDKTSPSITGTTDFEKKLKILIYNEIGSEGSFCSINAWDTKHFTLGKGFAVTGDLMDVIDNLLNTGGENYLQIFNNVGIQVVNKHFWVLDSEGNWLKDIPDQYEASDYIRNNKQLLSFFIELAEKKDYCQDVTDAQYNAIVSGAGDYPSYIIKTDKSNYNDNWNDESVSVLCHLSHWAGYRWNEGVDRYKDTKGDLDKILYLYIYKSVVTYSSMRIAIYKTDIYRMQDASTGGAFSNSYSYWTLINLGKWGLTPGIGKTKLEEKWNTHTKEFEFKKDKYSNIRVVQKNTKTYISNSECTLIKIDEDLDKFIIVTKDANTITYENFEE
jgi:hypothetical protein